MKQATGEQLGVDKITEMAIKAEEATENVEEEEYVYSSIEERKRTSKKQKKKCRTLGFKTTLFVVDKQIIIIFTRIHKHLESIFEFQCVMEPSRNIMFCFH